MANHLQARDSCKQHDKYMGKAFGTELSGANDVLGQLAFYRTESQYKPNLDPNASPAPMAGWKIEFGLRLKDVYLFLTIRHCVRERLCAFKLLTKKSALETK